MGKTTISGLAHIGLKTPDLQKSIDFYQKALEFELYYTKETETMGFAFMRNGSCIIEFLGPKGENNILDMEPTQYDHIALKVTDLDSEAKRLTEMGIEFIVEPKQVDFLFDGIKCLFFKGPSNERIELFEYL